MLATFSTTDRSFDRQLEGLLTRSHSTPAEIQETVAAILADVRERGDEAVLEYTRRFDGVNVESVTNLALDAAQIQDYARQVGSDVRSAIEGAAERIRSFHEKQLQQSWEYTEADGTRLGQKITPMGRAGIYVPGGKASYPSSVLMTAIPARVAGVAEIVMVVPKPGGELDPSVIQAALTAGVDRILTIGGAQAVAALAYGTDFIPRVDVIVGPGNIYVATAKKMVFGDVGIDMIAGPSEVLVVCDDTADPDWIAMDLFAQAEHDELAQSIALTDSPEMVEKIQSSVQRLLPSMSRREVIERSLKDNGAIIVARNREEIVDICDRIAPEHLEFMVDDASLPYLVDSVRNAGAIFAGRHSAEALGDYCAGPNHVLPTAGTARFSSPLGVYDFQKRTSILQASPTGAREMAAIAEVLAQSEGLTAHQGSAALRNTDNSKV